MHAREPSYIRLMALFALIHFPFSFLVASDFILALLGVWLINRWMDPDHITIGGVKYFEKDLASPEALVARLGGIDPFLEWYFNHSETLAPVLKTKLFPFEDFYRAQVSVKLRELCKRIEEAIAAKRHNPTSANSLIGSLKLESLRMHLTNGQLSVINALIHDLHKEIAERHSFPTKATSIVKKLDK